jgi:hypothetical protein
MAISSLAQKEPVAIAGSSGFIGSNLARIFKKENIPFIVLKTICWI